MSSSSPSPHQRYSPTTPNKTSTAASGSYRSSPLSIYPNNNNNANSRRDGVATTGGENRDYGTSPSGGRNSMTQQQQRNSFSEPRRPYLQQQENHTNIGRNQEEISSSSRLQQQQDTSHFTSFSSLSSIPTVHQPTRGGNSRHPVDTTATNQQQQQQQQMYNNNNPNFSHHDAKQQLNTSTAATDLSSTASSSHASFVSSTMGTTANQHNNSTSMNPSLHSLKCELQLWQDAYQSAQEGHANRIKQLLKEQKGREDEIRREMREKWDRKFEEIQRDTELIEREMKWMIQVMLGGVSSNADDSSASPGGSRYRSSPSRRANNSSDQTFSESLNNILKDLINILNGHHSKQGVSSPSGSSTTATSHLMNDFKSRFHALLKNIQQQYSQLNQQCTRYTELNQQQQVQLQQQEHQLEQVSHNAEEDRHQLLTLQQEKAQIDLEFARQKQIIADLREDKEKLENQLREETTSSTTTTTDLQQQLKALKREREDLQGSLHEANLQLSQSNRSLEQKEHQLTEVRDKLSEEQETSRNLRETIEHLEEEIQKLHTIENRFKTLQQELSDHNEEYSSNQQLIEELQQELHEVRTDFTQTEAQLKNELSEWKRQTQEAELALESTTKSSTHRHTQYEEQIKHLEQTHEQERALHEKQIADLEDQLKELREKTQKQIESEHHSVISRLTGIISTYNQNNLTKNDDPITQISSVFEHYEKRIVEIQEKSFVMQASFKSRELKYESKISELEYQLRAKQSQMDDLKHDIEIAIEKMESKIGNDVKIRGEERQRYKTVISVLQQQIENSGLPKSPLVRHGSKGASLDGAAQNADKLRKYKRSLGKLREENQALQLETHKMESEIKQLKQNASLLKKQNAQLKTELKKSNDKCDSLNQQMRISVDKDTEAIEELVQQNADLKQQVDDLITQQGSKQDRNANFGQDERNQLSARLKEITTKYKHIKDKYIRQSLRQNELQNYILNLHRTGRVSLDPPSVASEFASAEKRRHSYSSDTSVDEKDIAPAALEHRRRSRGSQYDQMPAGEADSVPSSRSTSPGRSQHVQQHDMSPEASSFDENMREPESRVTPNNKTRERRDFLEDSPPEDADESAHYEAAQYFIKRATTLKKVSTPTRQPRRRHRSSSVPKKRSGSSSRRRSVSRLQSPPRSGGSNQRYASRSRLTSRASSVRSSPMKRSASAGRRTRV